MLEAISQVKEVPALRLNGFYNEPGILEEMI
jgi:hypothetical protein